VVAWRADPEAERMHAPFWPAREPGAGDRRDWGRQEYLAELLGQEFELEFEEGELRLTAGSGEEMLRFFASYDGAAKAHVDSLHPPRAEEYRRAFIAYHERYRANGRISLPRRYLLTLGRRRWRFLQSIPVRRDDIATAPLAKPAARQIAAILPAGPRQPPAVSAMIGALRSASTTQAGQ
jgi:hypothetical protein